MCWHFETHLDGDTTAPALARAFVRRQLHAQLEAAEPADDIDDALLVVSELVTNAVQAGSSTLTVVGCLHHGELELEVTDHAPGWPTRQHPDPTSQHGRGLLLVDATSTHWGVKPSAHGKTVWAILPLPTSLTTSLTCDTTSRILSR